MPQSALRATLSVTAPNIERWESDMADLVYIAVALTFFAVCVAYVRGLDRIVRAAEEAEKIHEETAP